MQTGHAISPGRAMHLLQREGGLQKIKHSSCNCFRTPRAQPRLELRLQLAEPEQRSNKKEKEESSSTCSCYSNWEQPCFTVNGLSIFAAGSYGSWIYVPIAFCIYRLWPPAPAPAPVSGFSCLSVSPIRPSAL